MGGICSTQGDETIIQSKTLVIRGWTASNVGVVRSFGKHFICHLNTHNQPAAHCLPYIISLPKATSQYIFSLKMVTLVFDETLYYSQQFHTGSGISIVQKACTWIRNSNYRLAGDGNRTWMRTASTLRIIDKRREYFSVQSLLFFNPLIS
jgi:hypothetical protein